MQQQSDDHMIMNQVYTLLDLAGVNLHHYDFNTIYGSCIFFTVLYKHVKKITFT